MKAAFNEMLLQGAADPERMHSLKVLINNYSSLGKMDVLRASNEELRKTVAGLKTSHTQLWCVYTFEFQACIVGPTIFPLLLHIAKKLLQ